MAAIDILVISAANRQIVIALSHWIASTSVGTLLPQLSLSDSLGYRVVASASVLSLIEELGGHHHLLLVAGVGGLPLIH